MHFVFLIFGYASIFFALVTQLPQIITIIKHKHDDYDWCSFEYDNNLTDTGFGLNPPYPNPITSQDWGPFGDSYQICYQFSTPYDDTWSNLNNVNINIINTEGEIIHSYNDNYANGQVGICAYISTELIDQSIYRMIMESGDFECHGDIQFNN